MNTVTVRNSHNYYKNYYSIDKNIVLRYPTNGYGYIVLSNLEEALFMSVISVGNQDAKVLKYIAFEVLQPLYGDQTKAFSEWLSGDGFKQAFLLKNDVGKSQGFVSLKINPSINYVKISTFFIMPDFRGNGIGKELLNWVFDYVLISTNVDFLKVTISEDKPESLAFFQKHKFKVIDQVEGKYFSGKTEFILQKELVREKIASD